MICSEKLRDASDISAARRPRNWIGSYLLPKRHTIYSYNARSLLVLLLLFYVNLFKERFFVAPFLSEASAKVRQIFVPCKYFEENFQEIVHFFVFIDKHQMIYAQKRPFVQLYCCFLMAICYFFHTFAFRKTKSLRIERTFLLILEWYRQGQGRR